MKKIIISILLIMLVIIIVCGCENSDKIKFDNDKVTVVVQEPIEFAEGLDYNIIITNSTEETIKQLSVAFSIADNDKTSGSSNDKVTFYAKPTNASINIKPAETRLYHVHVPLQLLNTELIDLDDIHIELDGYYQEIIPENHFMKLGALRFFK